MVLNCRDHCNWVLIFSQTGLNVCTILESEIVWEKFRCGTGCPEPLVIHYSDYSKGKVCHRILAGRVEAKYRVQYDGIPPPPLKHMKTTIMATQPPQNSNQGMKVLTVSPILFWNYDHLKNKTTLALAVRGLKFQGSTVCDK